MLKSKSRTRCLALIALAALMAPAQAAELTLNDLPAVLNTLRECQSTEATLFRKPILVCRYDEREIWVALQLGSSNGTITIFFNHDGIKLTGSGATVNDALGDLAAKLNATQFGAKRAVDLLGPFLPSQ